MRAYIFGVLCLISVSGQAMVDDSEKNKPPSPVLHAKFFYATDIGTAGTLAEHCKKSVKTADLLTDIAVGLAGKAAESLIDAAAARTQPEATTLDAVVPLDGFYGPKGSIAVEDGCLAFHNGTDDKGSNATLLAVFQLKTSTDRSAFRFSVVNWKFNGFLKAKSTQWFQSRNRRDIALKIEFLTPGNASLGTRQSFIEHVFPGVEADALSTLFISDQELPWFAAPPRPDTKSEAARVLPLNLRVTVVETTRPNQLGLWVRAVAQENREAVSTLVQNSVREALDPSYEATESAKLAEAAGTAYGAYKTAWDELKAHQDAKPAATDIAATKAWVAGFTVKRQAVASKQTLARIAFDTAGLAWPGNLPELSPN